MSEFDVYAHFYDLDVGDMEDDLLMIEQFAARCGSPILELACGTGRVLLHLARQGYQITGIDVSADMLDRARNKIAAEGLAHRATLARQDMRQLDLDGRFNLAFATLNSFVHLPTTDDQLAALARIRHHLNPGGILLLDLFNPDPGRLLDCRGQITLRKVMADPETGHRLMSFRSDSVDLAQQTIYVTFVLDRVDGEGKVDRTIFPFTMRYLFRFELELLLRYAGFEVEAMYGSYDLDEYSGDSDKMIAVARRPD